MKFDFYRDLKNEVNQARASWGLRPVGDKPFSDYFLDYLTLLKKLVSRTKRIVQYNPDLLRELPTHPKQKEIRELERRFTAGIEANCFQSKRLLQSNFHDHLAYEWNIYHFHLSLQPVENSRFVKQVPQLLLVHVSDTQATFLGTDDHSPGAFADVKWLEILHDHFPHIIEPYRDNKISVAHPIVSAVERQTLWDKGYTLGMTNVRDKVYWSPGLGRTTSGHNIQVTRQCDEVLRWMHEVSEPFTHHYNQICAFLQIDPAVAHFRLRFGDVTLEIIELSTKQIVLTFPERVKNMT